MALRLLTSATLASVAIALGACGPDPQATCTQLYHHLTDLAKRNADPEGELRFVSACVDAWDPKRVQCLQLAQSVGAALACKPVKKRPG